MKKFGFGFVLFVLVGCQYVGLYEYMFYVGIVLVVDIDFEVCSICFVIFYEQDCNIYLIGVCEMCWGLGIMQGFEIGGVILLEGCLD